MSSGTHLAAASLIAVSLATGLAVGQAERLYWQDVQSSLIYRMEPDGSAPQVVVSGRSVYRGIAADHTGGSFYWLDDGRVRRANLDGTYVEDLITGLNLGLSSIRLDIGADQMYWVDGNAGSIMRAKLDGSELTQVGGGPGLAALALDLVAGKIYWSESGPVEKIRRANLDGSNREDVYVFGADASPTSLAVDSQAGYLYWVDGNAHVIARSALDGTDPHVLVQVQGTPFDIDIDTVGGKIYWSERSTNTISRANLNGSQVEVILSNFGSSGMGGLAILPTRRPPFKSPRNGHSYYLTDLKHDWLGAHASGIATGGTLASITDQAELDWILSAIPPPADGSEALWLGGRDGARAEWTWLTGELFEFQAWRAGEPNGDPLSGESYLWMWADGPNRGLWEDLYNGDQDSRGGAYGLVEFDCRVDLTADGTVDTLDFLLFLGAWSSSNSLADWNLDGIVNTLDFLAYLNAWVAGC